MSGSASKKQPKEQPSRNRSRIPSDDWMRIEVDNTSAISPATQILSEALRTNAPEVRCMICKAMTPSEYVLRKHHVSSVHMPKDHTESDYVEILSALMQKAYPTLTYNDLQCQIGGCRKEYKCQSARRTHVLRIHFQNELSCPLKLCSFRSNDFPRINTHLKEDHGLPNGYLSIESSATRDQFNADRAKHNHRLTTLVQLAFPCPIPESCKSGFRVSEANSPGETIHSLITRIREKDRKFQTVPPNPLRLRSPSSSSDSDSTEPEKVSKPSGQKIVEKDKGVSGSSSKMSTPSKNKQTEPRSSPEGIQASTSSSSSSSTSSDSDEEKVIAKENKPLTPDKQQNRPSENGSVAKRKKLDSSSSSSSTSSDSGDEGSKSGWSLCSNVSKKSNASNNTKGKDNEVPGSDVDSMWNNASEKSDSSSESGDEIQLVACIPTTSPRSTAKEVTIDEVVLDDDDDDAVAAPCTPTKSKTSSPSPKQPTIRTLSISGVSVRTDGEQLTTTPEKGVGASSERAFPR
ncbi:zinc finger, C2H2 type [Ancylostoma caninum]|uniref:Zinc finger, C2H2 type n=1 Tax=Ancylostoma caninum TaxID=29170 RepID=A0A368F9H6_ANCCA|nr:zinc finger, C2H2 type [Ancylostoma caninum]